jgi:hypothetical protein
MKNVILPVLKQNNVSISDTTIPAVQKTPYISSRVPTVKNSMLGKQANLYEKESTTTELVFLLNRRDT